MITFADRFARQDPCRASTGLSPGFALRNYSSPSFGSQQSRSYSHLSVNLESGRWCQPRGRGRGPSHLSRPNRHSLSFRAMVCHHNTRMNVALLGPCFKTGLIQTFSYQSFGAFATDTTNARKLSESHPAKKSGLEW